MKGIEKLIMELYVKIILNCKEFYPRYSLDRRSAPAGNPTPAVHPASRRVAMDTGVIRVECTPVQIYFSHKLCP
jgi:hypothetical protein